MATSIKSKIKELLKDDTTNKPVFVSNSNWHNIKNILIFFSKCVSDKFICDAELIVIQSAIINELNYVYDNSTIEKYNKIDTYIYELFNFFYDLAIIEEDYESAGNIHKLFLKFEF